MLRLNGAFTLCNKWDYDASNQAFTAKKDPAFGPLVQELGGLANVTLGHVAFKPHSGVPQSSL